MGKEQKNKPSSGDRMLIPPKYQHATAIAVLFFSLIIFFWGVIIEKRTFVASDTIASRSFWTLADDASRQGVFPLWNPYIFCGMPGYASLSIFGERAFDISNYIMETIRTYFALMLNHCDIGYIFFYYFIFGIGVYLFVFQKLKDKLAAFIAAFGVMHSTTFIMFI